MGMHETMEKRLTDVEHKIQRVRQFLNEQSYSAVLFQRQDNFAWLTSGGQNGIPYNKEAGECGVVVTRQDVFLVSNTIEKPRIVDEEISGLPFQVVSYRWYEGFEDEVHKLIGYGKCASDMLMKGLTLENRLPQLRYSLTNLEIERYRYAGQLATELMEQYCMTVEPGQTELEIAAGLNQAYLQNGLIPTVTLVACDERLDSYRHPIATAKQFERKCMIVSCVQYKGLVVALTRIISNGKLPEDVQERFACTAKVDAEMIQASKQGVYTDELFEYMTKLYRNVGYDGEWKYHHQGGSIGYQNRDYLITPTSRYGILHNQAFAWNPSIQGTKSEDTIIVGNSASEVISVSKCGWPQLKVALDNGGFMNRPAIFER